MLDLWKRKYDLMMICWVFSGVCVMVGGKGGGGGVFDHNSSISFSSVELKFIFRWFDVTIFDKIKSFVFIYA